MQKVRYVSEAVLLLYVAHDGVESCSEVAQRPQTAMAHTQPDIKKKRLATLLPIWQIYNEFCFHLEWCSLLSNMKLFSPLQQNCLFPFTARLYIHITYTVHHTCTPTLHSYQGSSTPLY